MQSFRLQRWRYYGCNEGRLKMFSQWLKNTSGLSDSSVYKYAHAVGTISKEMLNRNVISKPLGEMELFEIDLAIALIFKNEYFIVKNTTGNNMYSNALKWYRNYIQSNIFEMAEAQREEEKISNDATIERTERDAIVKSRIGQGRFRDRVLSKYGTCIITGLDISRLLVASHIKPWAVSTNEERISENNGLLLSATYDRLFDSGLISFVGDGKMIISRFVTEKNREKLKIASGDRYNLLYNPQMKEFLEYHNDVVFIK